MWIPHATVQYATFDFLSTAFISNSFPCSEHSVSISIIAFSFSYIFVEQIFREAFLNQTSLLDWKPRCRMGKFMIIIKSLCFLFVLLSILLTWRWRTSFWEEVVKNPQSPERCAKHFFRTISFSLFCNQAKQPLSLAAQNFFSMRKRLTCSLMRKMTKLQTAMFLPLRGWNPISWFVIPTSTSVPKEQSHCGRDKRRKFIRASKYACLPKYRNWPSLCCLRISITVL